MDPTSTARGLTVPVFPSGKQFPGSGFLGGGIARTETAAATRQKQRGMLRWVVMWVGLCVAVGDPDEISSASNEQAYPYLSAETRLFLSARFFPLASLPPTRLLYLQCHCVCPVPKWHQYDCAKTSSCLYSPLQPAVEWSYLGVGPSPV